MLNSHPIRPVDVHDEMMDACCEEEELFTLRIWTCVILRPRFFVEKRLVPTVTCAFAIKAEQTEIYDCLRRTANASGKLVFID